MNSTFNKIGSRLRRHAKHWRTGALENFSPTRSQRGVIMLFTILGVGTLALGAALTVAIGSLTELSKNRNTVSGDQVFYTGEAAVSEGAYRYLTASSYLTTAGQMLNNTSTSTVEVTPLSWPYVKAKGKAANDRTHRGVVRIITQYPEGLAFDYAIYAQNDLGFGGNATVNGNVYSSTQIDFTGNSSEVNGNAFSPGDIESDNVSGFSVTGIDPIPPPSIDIEPYRVIALAAGTYFTSTPLAKDYLSNQTRQAVVVVEDAPELKLQNSTQLTGSLVTENDLELTGGTYSATGTYAAIVVYGNLRVAGGTTINGVVYVLGETSFGSGNNTINGSLISAGGASVDVTGSATINYDPAVGVEWESLTGLNTSTTSQPEIILWEEE